MKKLLAMEEQRRNTPVHAHFASSLAVLAVSASLLAGCQTPTQLLVEVRADGSVAERTSQIQVRVNDVMSGAFDGRTVDSFPISFGVEPSGDDLSRPVRIEVVLLAADDSAVANGSAVETFVEGEKVLVVIEITGFLPDGGVPDGGAPDGGFRDGGVRDGGVPDGGLLDSSTPDGGNPDAGSPDTGADTGAPDVRVDTGTDSGTTDSGTDAGPCELGQVYCGRLGRCVNPANPAHCGLGCDVCDALRPVCGPDISGVLLCQGGCTLSSECGINCCCIGDPKFSDRVCRARFGCEGSGFTCESSS